MSDHAQPGSGDGELRPAAFRRPESFRAWLEAHHATATELIVRCYKSHARHKGVTYPQAVDEALCFGWIDGVRRALDEASFSVRFSPRKAKSGWSKINVKRARELQAEGRMHPAGMAAFARRQPTRYSFESRPVTLSPAVEKTLESNREALAFWRTQPPWYRRTTAFWVMSAKQEETRARRLAILVDCLARGRTIPVLTRKK